MQLEYNQLTSFDSWPFARANSYPKFHTSVSYNKISNFTNIEGWMFKCGMRSLETRIDLNGNPLGPVAAHIKLIVQTETDLFCMFSKDAHSNLVIGLEDVLVTCDCQIYPIVIATGFSPMLTVLIRRTSRNLASLVDRELCIWMLIC